MATQTASGRTPTSRSGWRRASRPVGSGATTATSRCFATCRFELAAGETLVVLGPNGAGKSTLLRMLATLLRPTAGELQVLGAELPRRGVEGARADRLPRPRPASLRRPHRCGGTSASTPSSTASPTPEERIAELLDAVGLERRAGQLVRTLSAGQLQRAAVCRCVLHEPELLLLDEPGAHLDPRATGWSSP